MTTVEVRLEARSYPIRIVPSGLVGLADAIEAAVGKKRLAIVTDKRVNRLYGVLVQAALREAGFDAHTFVMGVGERFKTITTVTRLWTWLFEHGFDRATTCVVALGGGVVGDVAAFAASTWLRGVPLVQAPTTLLAQVDSSVGGKTGFNLGGAKNMVGTFYQPRLVYAALRTLETLELRDYRSGLAEVVKHGVLGDPTILETIEAEPAALKRRDPAVVGPLVAMCCRVKRDVVVADEREAGLRRILNLGHTFGHAIESYTNHRVRHGEAVALGMVIASRISERMGFCTPDVTKRVIDVLASTGLDVDDEPYRTEEVAALVSRDKKVSGDTVTFVVIEGIGQVSTTAIPVNDLGKLVRK